MPERLRLAVHLGAWCALRYGDVAELRRSDIDVKTGLSTSGAVSTGCPRNASSDCRRPPQGRSRGSGGSGLPGRDIAPDSPSQELESPDSPGWFIERSRATLPRRRALAGTRPVLSDADANLFVANQTTNTIREFSPTGADLGNFATTGLNGPTGLAFDKRGNLYASNINGDTIRRFSPTGQDLGNFATTGMITPVGLAFGPEPEDEDGDA